MNKLKVVTSFFLLVIFLCSVSVTAHMGQDHAAVYPPTNTDGKVFEKINIKYKQRIKPIFEKKCFDCHSTKTNFPWYYKVPMVGSMIDDDIREARKHLNMDNDFPIMGHGNPKDDLIAIEKSITENKMPPLNYVIMHAQSRLTESEKKLVRGWVEFSLKMLDQK